MTATVKSTQCLYVFGITDAAEKEPALPIAAQLSRTRVADLAVVHRTIDASDLADVDDDLGEQSRLAAVARAHDAIVQALHEVGTVLPVRMGTVFADCDQLRDVLARHAVDLATALERVGGQDEWRVRLSHADAPSESTTTRPASGADYLHSRRATRDRAQQQREALDGAWGALDTTLSGLAIDSANAGTRGTRAYLVPRTERETFASTAAEAITRMEQLGGAVTVAGPLPPYAFVDARLGNSS